MFWSKKEDNTEKRDILANAGNGSWLYNALSGSKTGSGVAVTESKAMTYSAIWGAVRIISETIASLPLPIYSRNGAAKSINTSHNVYGLLHDAPNDNMTAMVFRETLMAHVLTWGNGFARIVFANSGRPESLQLLQPDKVTVCLSDKGALVYRVKGAERDYSAAEILHVPGLGFNGLVGYSPIRMACREPIGIGLAAEMSAGSFFANGARVGGVLKVPGTLDTPGKKALKEAWDAAHGGSSKTGGTAVLENGMEYQQIGIPPEEAQLLESRRFQVTEIARIYRLPPHMLGDLTQSSFSNIEQQSIDFVIHSIRPWLVRLEQEYNRKLFTKGERQNTFTEHNVNGLLRGDIASRYNAYNTGRNGGWLSANDIRKSENLNPIEGGDVYLTPLNMASAENIESEKVNENE